MMTGYEPLVPTLIQPDPDDRHVLAAAIHAQAELIVTSNLSDSPASVLSGYGIQAIHPDDFIARLWDENTPGVLAAVKLHRANLKRPPKTRAESLATLELCRLA